MLRSKVRGGSKAAARRGLTEEPKEGSKLDAAAEGALQLDEDIKGPPASRFVEELEAEAETERGGGGRGEPKGGNRNRVTFSDAVDYLHLQGEVAPSWRPRRDGKEEGQGSLAAGGGREAAPGHRVRGGGAGKEGRPASEARAGGSRWARAARRTEAEFVVERVQAAFEGPSSDDCGPSSSRDAPTANTR